MERSKKKREGEERTLDSFFGRTSMDRHMKDKEK